MHLHHAHPPPRLPLYLHLLHLSSWVAAWPHDSRRQPQKCPGPEWNAMCRSCCEYEQILCKCPAQGTKVGYAVPCCRNAQHQCDPCTFHQGCSIFENCKTCGNGTWEAQDDFYVRGKYCTKCRQGWSGGDCLTCGSVIRRPQGHLMLESYPINARCEWTVHVTRGMTMELRFSMLNLEFDHSCSYDYVEVRDGHGPNSRIIGRYCGDESPPPIRSSGDSLVIRFVSDGYNNYEGFFATFQEVSACSSYPCLNGGTCFLDPGQSFRCVCAAKYTGPRCEKWQGRSACALPESPAHGDLVPEYESGGVLSSVQYVCHPDHTLRGASRRTCLPDGTWGQTSPTCVRDEPQPAIRVCQPLPRVPHGYSIGVMGTGGIAQTVEFACNNSYVLSGPSTLACFRNGTWSGSQPMCVKACREPKVSKLVRQRVLKPQAPSRQSPVHKLSSSTKQDMPGASIRGKESHVLRALPSGFHQLYTSIEYECASPLYQHFGSARRSCLKTGKWSGRHVSCSPVCGKLSSAGSEVLADTRWPWHAAIYRRFPNRSGAGTARRGDEFASINGKMGEGGGGWQLVCSGALVNQHYVVVAAHCVAETAQRQPASPADVKVLMGKQYLSDLKESTTLQHVQVSTILIHPGYDPQMFDSDLAVLKLSEKTRISERVLPLCLPRMQGGEVIAQQAFMTGWPITGGRESGPQSDLDERAQTGLIELADVSKCERQYAQNGVEVSITDNMLCGRQHPQRPLTVCPVNTGGIAFVQSQAPLRVSPALASDPSRGRDPDTSWELLGLVSFGYDLEKCDPKLYTVYTRVVNFKNWIEKNIK